MSVLCACVVISFMHLVSCFPTRPRLLQALVGLFELPEDDSLPDDEHFIEIEDTPGELVKG